MEIPLKQKAITLKLQMGLHSYYLLLVRGFGLKVKEWE